MASSHQARHIQDFENAKELEPHWGYAERVVPCVNDPGSCAYLDVVYGSHDLGMIYVGAFWAIVLAVLLLWAALRRVGAPTSSLGINTEAEDANRSSSSAGGLVKARRALGAATRRYTLPDALRVVFGRTTRFQVFILFAICAYLIVFTFAGMTYDKWITPVSDHPGYFNTRTTIGPWSNRIGLWAYALTPLSILLSSRESILSLITGVPYQSFNFLHRWLGYVILAQSALHTIGWCIVELRLYQPQPDVGREWIVQEYMIWGLVAMILLVLIFALSTPWGIRLTGYEFFRKAHYVLAMIFIGACWAHWEALKALMIPSLVFWFVDRAARFVRTALLHHQYIPSSGGMGFRSADATITRFPQADGGDVIRLDMDMEQDPWIIGQHYYLTFTKLSIWQSHPFTPLNAPTVKGGQVRHSYLLRAKAGETKKLAALAAAQAEGASPVTTPVIATGAYGENILSKLSADTNVICVAGGTGITYVLPVLLQLANQVIIPDRKIELIWAVRHASDVEWIEEEMNLLHKVQRALNLTIRLYATRDVGSGLGSSTRTSIIGQEGEKVAEKTVVRETAASSSSQSDEITPCDCGDDVPVKKTGAGADDRQRHPDLEKLVNDFVGATIRGRTSVIASGPGGMISDLRSIVASCNSPSKVWNGEERFDVDLICDDRLEW